MKSNFPALLFLAFLPGFVHALGLGQIIVDSGLNQPFSARIELLSATVEEMDSLRVGLADKETFSRAGMRRSPDLAQLLFTLKEGRDGQYYVHVTSREPVREPFLEFIVEAGWARGRLVRAYTVLLDPPDYAVAETRRQVVMPEPALPPDAGDQAVGQVPVVEDTGPPRIVSAPERSADYRGGDSWTTTSGDTLSSIASRMRPDSSISVNQMMLALLRANPEAFISGNINRLKGGVDLRIPDMKDIQSLGKSEADAEVRSQNMRWQDVQTIPLVSVTQPQVVPQSAMRDETAESPVEDTPVQATADAGEPELRILGVDTTNEPGGQSRHGRPGTGSDTEALVQELALARESLETLKIENVELEDRLSAAETIIDDLKSELERGLQVDVVVAEKQILYEYGPTVTGDTLWAIALKVRPDPSISVNQMMLAILRANPAAFIAGNINGLKAGVTLLIPGVVAIQSLSKSEATAEVISHNDLWKERRST